MRLVFIVAWSTISVPIQTIICMMTQQEIDDHGGSDSDQVMFVRVVQMVLV